MGCWRCPRRAPAARSAPARAGSAGYFGSVDEIQRQIELAYASDEQLLRESALVGMGRSMQSVAADDGRELESQRRRSL